MIELELYEERRTLKSMGDRSSDETSRKCRTEDRSGDPVGCTGRQCRSCTGGAVADCVAICCCPCAVLNCLALAFVKIPFLVGKRWCLGIVRKRRKKKKKGRKTVLAEGRDGDGDAAAMEVNDDGGGMDSWFEIGFEEGAIPGRTIEKVDGCGDRGGSCESDKLWLELCEFDHLSFGRVSFSGIPLQLQG